MDDKIIIDREALTERFLKYIKMDTHSDNNDKNCPSTENQWAFAKLLKKDLEIIGLADVFLDENCYLTATLPSNENDLPALGFIAHMDTAPSFNSDHVEPQIINNYNGKDITLDPTEKIILSVCDFPQLKNSIGETVIVTNGKTLLGADDKAGIVEIIHAMIYLKEHPQIKHGIVKICFTPDEEIGRGADLFNIKKFNCDFAYTVDGGPLGQLEYENFNAAWAKITIKGRDIHPGTAKGIMINSILIGMELQSMLPSFERPECTEKYEGFFLLMDIKGTVEHTEMEYIIRDHDINKFTEKKLLLHETVDFLKAKYKKAEITIDMEDSYFNMKDKIIDKMYIIDLAERSMKDIGITPVMDPIRGGTDGARLSYMGLPCPNLFTGGENFHGKYEYISIESMLKASQVIVKIVENSKYLKVGK